MGRAGLSKNYYTIEGLPTSLVFRPPPSLWHLLRTSRPYESQCERLDRLICEEDNQISQESTNSIC